ncbi:hypothetical protein Taro_013377, partial [Colocasia esculenta]|nr:hypothetical protein [Colocasia esculenta]
MKVAPKVIVLVRDADGVGPAISDGLHAGPVSSLTSTGPLRHVSIVLLPNYQPPVAACAVNEILASIMSDNSSELPTVIAPLFLLSQKFTQESVNLKSSGGGVAIFGVGIGHVTESDQAMLVGIPRPPPSLQVNCETLACLLQMIQVLKIPTIVAGTTIKRQGIKAKAVDLE